MGGRVQAMETRPRGAFSKKVAPWLVDDVSHFLELNPDNCTRVRLAWATFPKASSPTYNSRLAFGAGP